MGESFFYIEIDEKNNRLCIEKEQYQRNRKMTMDIPIIKRNLINKNDN
jgi:hypothetical protein